MEQYNKPTYTAHVHTWRTYCRCVYVHVRSAHYECGGSISREIIEQLWICTYVHVHTYIQHACTACTACMYMYKCTYSLHRWWSSLPQWVQPTSIHVWPSLFPEAESPSSPGTSPATANGTRWNIRMHVQYVRTCTCMHSTYEGGLYLRNQDLPRYLTYISGYKHVRITVYISDYNIRTYIRRY